MQRKKLGNLFNFVYNLLAFIANKNKSEKLFLGNIGEEIGLLFQFTDDFLDKKGS